MTLHASLTLNYLPTDPIYRPRHKPSCTVSETHKAYKDGIIRLVRALLANPSLMIPLKGYVRSLLDLDTDRTAGFRTAIVLTVTTIPDAAARAGKPMRMLQFARVAAVPVENDAGMSDAEIINTDVLTVC